MGLGKFIKGAINVVGVAAKVGVELGADAVGAIAEKIDDNPESKEKFKNMGKKLGQDIKSGTNKIAEGSEDVIDNAVESGAKICKDIGDEFNKTINKVKSNKDSNSYEVKVDFTVEDDEIKNDSNVNVDGDITEINEVKVTEVNEDKIAEISLNEDNEESYGVISIKNDDTCNN